MIPVSAPPRPRADTRFWITVTITGFVWDRATWRSTQVGQTHRIRYEVNEAGYRAAFTAETGDDMGPWLDDDWWCSRDTAQGWTPGGQWSVRRMVTGRIEW